GETEGEPARRPQRRLAGAGARARERRGHRRARQRDAPRAQQDREGARSDRERYLRHLRRLRPGDSARAPQGAPLRGPLHPLRDRRRGGPPPLTPHGFPASTRAAPLTRRSPGASPRRPPAPRRESAREALAAFRRSAPPLAP